MVEAREQTLRAIYDALARRDAALMETLVGDGFELHSSTGRRLGKDEPYQGPGGVDEYMADLAELWTELRVIVYRFEHSGPLTFGAGQVWARNKRILIDSPCSWIWEFSGPEDEARPIRCEVFEDATEGRRDYERRLAARQDGRSPSQ